MAFGPQLQYIRARLWGAALGVRIVWDQSRAAKVRKPEKARFNVDLERLEAWVSEQIAKNVDTEYLTVSPLVGRQWPQKAKITVADISIDSVVAELDSDIRSFCEDLRDDDTHVSRIKVVLYKCKGVYIKEKTFVVSPQTDTSNAKADGDGTKEGETVAFLREMRLIVGDQNKALLASNETIKQIGAGSLQLAMGMMEKMTTMGSDLAQAEAALVVSANEKYDPMRELVEICKPVIPGVIMAIAQKLSEGKKDA